MKTISVRLGERSYDITIGEGILSRAGELFNLERRIIVVTDEGVPREYAEAVLSQCKEGKIVTLPMGEGTKSFKYLEYLLSEMMEFNMTRGDALCAVGGGVIGDLCGFAASTYMRGIDFYNVPTTLLSQVDSSIGGKTAINLGSVKNIVGAFHQPRGVLIDINTLKTLSKRHFAAGMCEALKMACTCDAALFEKFESGIGDDELIEVIAASLMIKKTVVEQDERECGLRKILNFGHTFGHGIEANEGLIGLYHGECVALGMIPMCAPEIKGRLIRALSALGLPTEYSGDIDRALEYVAHDKKCRERGVECIFVDKIGTYRIEKLSLSDFNKHIKDNLI